MAALKKNQLWVSIDGAERKAETLSVAYARVDADADTVTFADAEAGALDEWEIRGTALQDPGDPDSVWNILWDSTPGTQVPVIIKPYANATASATHPWYSATAIVSWAGTEEFLGGEADMSTSARRTFDFKWKLTAKPTKVTS